MYGKSPSIPSRLFPYIGGHRRLLGIPGHDPVNAVSRCDGLALVSVLSRFVSGGRHVLFVCHTIFACEGSNVLPLVPSRLESKRGSVGEVSGHPLIRRDSPSFSRCLGRVPCRRAEVYHRELRGSYWHACVSRRREASRAVSKKERPQGATHARSVATGDAKRLRERAKRSSLRLTDTAVGSV